MSIGIVQAVVNLGTAVALGAVIGFERQWRIERMMKTVPTKSIRIRGSRAWVARMPGLLQGTRSRGRTLAPLTALASP